MSPALFYALKAGERDYHFPLQIRLLRGCRRPDPAANKSSFRSPMYLAHVAENVQFWRWRNFFRIPHAEPRSREFLGAVHVELIWPGKEPILLRASQRVNVAKACSVSCCFGSSDRYPWPRDHQEVRRSVAPACSGVEASILPSGLLAGLTAPLIQSVDFADRFDFDSPRIQG